jgi:hypothetical protein
MMDAEHIDASPVLDLGRLDSQLSPAEQNELVTGATVEGIESPSAD